MRHADVSIERRFLVALLWLLPAITAIASDPTSWTGASVPATAWLRTVEYGGGKFIALGDDGTRLLSANGTDWVAHHGNPSEAYHGSTFDGGSFWVTGQRFNADRTSWTGIIQSSADGETWTERFAGAQLSVLDIAAGGGKLVAVAGASLSGPIIPVARAVVSTDGSAWSTNDIGAGFWPYSVAYGNGIFVVMGSSQAFWSTDGLHWNSSPLPSGRRLSAVTFDGQMFVATGDRGTVAVSSDARDWTLRSTPTTEDLWAVAFGSSCYVAVGKGGTIITSRNARDWTLAEWSGADLGGVAAGGGKGVAVGRYGSVVWSELAASTPVLRLAISRGPKPIIQIFGTTGRRYRIEASNTCGATGQWSKLVEIAALPSSPYSIEDPFGWLLGRSFYRAVELP